MDKYTGLIDAPNTWLCFSILSTLCCCCPMGVVALVFSLKSEAANKRGDYPKASKYGRLAAWFNITAVCVTLFTLAVIFIYLFTWHNVTIPRNSTVHGHPIVHK